MYVINGVFNIGPEATVAFMYNKADYSGGAVGILTAGTMTVGTGAVVVFAYNAVDSVLGGALFLFNGTFYVKPNARINFSHNSVASGCGGAIYLNANSRFEIGTNASSLFYNNTATRGGAMCFSDGIMNINDHGAVNFSANSAQSQGGAIYIEVGEHPISVNKSAKLSFYNNRAFQGGAIYIIPSSFAIKIIGIESRTTFVNNAAADVGGAVYSERQSAAPCLFVVNDYSAEVRFSGNIAKKKIGQHMYGTSIRDSRCAVWHGKQGRPYCVYSDQPIEIKHINISLYPNLTSPVSSTALHVCLCDKNSKLQCADFSQIFTSVSVYRGEAFTLPACGSW